MLTSDKIKKLAKSFGADLVGIGSTERFEGAPAQMDPRYMFPDAKSVIVLGFRHNRGLFRGIEEGTFFASYSAMGYAGVNYIYQPLVIWRLAKVIEDEGYEAIGLPNGSPWTNMYDPAYTKLPPDPTASDPGFSLPVKEGLPAPNVFIQLRIAGYAAGLGEIGWSKMFLSKEFGPRQRLAAILTDAPLEADPLMEPGTLCDRCMACVKACSIGAIPKTEKVTIKIGGKKIEWADIDMAKCCQGFCGGVKAANPFMVTEEDEKEFTTQRPNSKHYKLKPLYVYARALEGASGCIRACMMHLEQQGKTKPYKNKFRRKPKWRLEN
jgi:ferredoxin